MNQSKSNQRQNAAIGWLVAFGLSLLGVLALPLYAESVSVLETDGAQVAPLLVLMAIVLVAALIGRTSPFASGLAAGIVALIALALSIAVVFGVVLTVVLGDFGDGIEWGGGAAAVVAAAISGIAVVLMAGRGWQGYSPDSWTPVATFGSLAVAAMVVGFVIPPEGQTWSDTLGFSAHPLVGLGSVVFLCAVAGLGIAGFAMGRWGVGLLAGFLGYLLLGWLTAQAGNQDEVFSWSGVGGADIHPVAAVGFWASAGLFVVHAIQQASGSVVGSSERMSTAPLASATVSSSASRPAERVAPSQPGWWAPDPFARFEHRFYDGEKWSNKVSSTGAVERDQPIPSLPANRAAAWITDPFGRHEYRYFDGKKWTDRVANRGTVDADPATAVAPEPSRVESFPPPRPGLAGPGAVGHATEPSLHFSGEALIEANDIGRTVQRSMLPSVGEPTSVDNVLIDRNGDRIRLDSPIIVGRSPVPLADHPSALLHPCADRTVTKSHAVFGLDDRGVWVIDLHSRNGVSIAGDPPRPVPPGDRTWLRVGDVVVLGDITVFEVASDSSQ